MWLDGRCQVAEEGVNVKDVPRWDKPGNGAGIVVRRDLRVERGIRERHRRLDGDLEDEAVLKVRREGPRLRTGPWLTQVASRRGEIEPERITHAEIGRREGDEDVRQLRQVESGESAVAPDELLIDVSVCVGLEDPRGDDLYARHGNGDGSRRRRWKIVLAAEQIQRRPVVIERDVLSRADEPELVAPANDVLLLWPEDIGEEVDPGRA